MKALKKTSAALIAFAVSASAFAGADLETRVSDIEKKIDMMSTTTAMGNFGPSTASARAEPNGMGWNLSFDVLYWQTKTGTNYCSIRDGVAPSPINYLDTVREAKFQWEWGFKAAVGYNFEHDNWDAKLEYTYFKNTAKDLVNTLALPSAVVSPLLDAADPLQYSSLNTFVSKNVAFSNAANAKSWFKNSYNDLYLDMGRDFFVSKYLSMRPGFGAEAAWITFKNSIRFWGGTAQSFNILSLGGYTNGYTIDAPFCYLNIWTKQRMFGVGPRASLDTRWHLGEGYSVYGNVNGALLYSYFHNYASVTQEDQPLNEAQVKYNFHRLIPTAKFELGLMYDKYIMCETQHIAFCLGYENQYFWDMNYIGAYPTGLGMYGVNLKVQWDF